jgi:hypothetical protein
VAREDLADVMTLDGTLIAEGVDDDVAGGCTWKDELMILAYSDSTWIPDLQNYLKEEREETEKLQGERMGRVTTWLQATVPVLTSKYALVFCTSSKMDATVLFHHAFTLTRPYFP